MSDPTETWSERIEREFDSFMRLLRRRRWLAILLILMLAVYSGRQYIPIPPGPPARSSQISTVSNGTVGWIYVGTQIRGQWQHSTADENEPELTLDVMGIPEPSKNYRVIRSLYLREAAPAQQADKSRPLMTTSKGVIGVNSVVKVDGVTQVEVSKPELRSWVWAHVTVVDAH